MHSLELNGRSERGMYVFGLLIEISDLCAHVTDIKIGYIFEYILDKQIDILRKEDNWLDKIVFSFTM